MTYFLNLLVALGLLIVTAITVSAAIVGITYFFTKKHEDIKKP